MANPTSTPGSIADVAGYILWQMGLGLSSAESLLFAQSNFAETVSPFNIQAGFNAAMNAASAAGMLESSDLTVNQQQEIVPFIAGAPPGYNYQVTVTLVNDETGDTEEREIRINTAGPLDHADICREAYLQVDEYIADSDRWQGLSRALSAESAEDIFDCEVTAVYAG